MATNSTNVRITYPLSLQEVEELTALEKTLKQKAQDAQKANRIGLHRAYTELMKYTTNVVTRERNRMSREDLARYNKAQRDMKEQAKNNPSSHASPLDEVSA